MANGLHVGARSSFRNQPAVMPFSLRFLPFLLRLVVRPPSGRRELKGRYMHARLVHNLPPLSPTPSDANLRHLVANAPVWQCGGPGFSALVPFRIGVRMRCCGSTRASDPQEGAEQDSRKRLHPSEGKVRKTECLGLPPRGRDRRGGIQGVAGRVDRNGREPTDRLISADDPPQWTATEPAAPAPPDARSGSWRRFASGASARSPCFVRSPVAARGWVRSSHEHPEDHLIPPIGGAGGRIGCGIVSKI